MKTLTEQYRLIKEDKGHKGVFLKEAKAKYPNLLKNNSTFKEATTILKQKNIISENFVGTPMVGNPLERNKESYETAFENFLAEAEAKAEEKKVTKEVEEDLSKNYNYSKEAGKSNPDTMIYGQIQMGVYYEAKQEKNADKTLEEIKDIVYKNLDKDSIYYTKNGQFGVDVGYTDDNVALGEPVEAKGEYKSSGYGKLKENIEMGIGGVYLLFKNNKLENIMFTDDMKPDEKLAKVLNSAGYETSFTSDSRFSQPKSINKFKGKSKEQLKLKENKEPVNEIAIAGGLVTGGGFTSANYMDFYGLHEEDTNEATDQEVKNKKAIADLEGQITAEKEKQASLEEYKMASQEKAEALLRAAEEYFQEVDTIDDVIYFIEANLETQESDIWNKYL